MRFCSPKPMRWKTTPLNPPAWACDSLGHDFTHASSPQVWQGSLLLQRGGDRQTRRRKSRLHPSRMSSRVSEGFATPRPAQFCPYAAWPMVATMACGGSKPTLKRNSRLHAQDETGAAPRVNQRWLPEYTDVIHSRAGGSQFSAERAADR